MSIDSQVKEMLQIADRENLEVVDIRRESHSAKDSGQRPVFNEILADLKTQRYNAILAWAPDRLSRNAGDLGSLVDLMDQKLLIEIKTYGQRFSNSPSEKFLLMILCSQAKLENDNRSINVKRGLRTRCEMGLWPAPAPTGYFNEKRIDRKCQVIVDPERGPIIKQMFEKVAYEHWSGRKVYHWLKFEINFKSVTSGKCLTLSNIYRLLQSPFYYGQFEYPAKSGNWYTGKHQPLITKEVFEKAREQLKRSEIKNYNKEFAFTNLMVCGLCGSGITAQEKFKKLKNGRILRYVYYGCTKSRDIHCKNGYVREEELVYQISNLINKADFKESEIHGKFREEAERYLKFQGSFCSSMVKKEKFRFDQKEYAVYILKEGKIYEKRELLQSLKSKIVLNMGKISLVVS